MRGVTEEKLFIYLPLPRQVFIKKKILDGFILSVKKAKKGDGDLLFSRKRKILSREIVP